MSARPALLLLSLLYLTSIASGAEPKSASASTAASVSATKPAGSRSTSLKTAIEQIRLATKTLDAIRSARDGAVASNRRSAGACDAEACQELRRQIAELQAAAAHGVDLRTAALQFSAAPDVASALVVGCKSEQQILADYTSMQTKVPAEFWADLKARKLIEQNAPVPTA
jgi:aryl-alcohol dehydrogenase-like predicted oxidoreductase